MIKSKDESEANQKKIRDSGFYPIVSSKKEVEELIADDSKVKALFKKLMAESIDGWISLAHERLKGTGVRCYISPGNDDFREIDSHLIDTGVVFNPEEKVVCIDDVHEMITLGTVNHTPWHSPREVDEDVLEGMIEKMASKVKNMQTCIFNIHVPPIDTIIY